MPVLIESLIPENNTDSMRLPSPQVIAILKRVQDGSMDVVGQTGPMDPPSQSVIRILEQFGFRN